MKNNTEEERRDIAQFRYRVIAPLLEARPGTVYRQVKELAQREWRIPGSKRTRVAPSTIQHWLHLYRRGKFEALKPKSRSDRHWPLESDTIDQIVFRHSPIGPLVPWLGGIAKWFNAKQFSHGTTVRRLRPIAQFSQWLDQQQIGLSNLSCKDVERYLQTKEGDAYLQARASLTHLMNYLQREDVISITPAVAVASIERCLADYEHDLCVRQNLATSTINSYKQFAGRFLRHCFGDQAVDLSRLQFNDVIAFVHHEAGRLASRNSTQLVTAALRSFLRYVHLHADGMPNLAAQVPTVANWAMLSIPRAIQPESIEKLLLSIDRTSVKGRRDYAILLLVARLGLRAIEIASLTLDDIDWNTATIRVTLKGGRRNVHPLTTEIGEAIADYLQNGRPRSDDRRVFLQIRAPIQGLSTTGIASVARTHIRAAGVDSPTKGTHQFRHGLATELLRHGASIQEIGDVLGHRAPDSTMIYTKTDIAALRTIALPWPGGVR